MGVENAVPTEVQEAIHLFKQKTGRKIQAHELSDMCKISVIQATQYLYGSKPYPSRRRLQVKFNKDGSINWGEEYKAAKQARWSRRHVKACSGYRFNESEAGIQKARRAEWK